jgi:hypothetical protein
MSGESSGVPPPVSSSPPPPPPPVSSSPPPVSSSPPPDVALTDCTNGSLLAKIPSIPAGAEFDIRPTEAKPDIKRTAIIRKVGKIVFLLPSLDILVNVMCCTYYISFY